MVEKEGKKSKSKGEKQQEDKDNKNHQNETQAETDFEDYPQEWRDAERIGCCDKAESCCFKFITIIPVIISFSVFSVLGLFYIFCFLYPCLLGDFFETLGIKDYWENDKDRQYDKQNASVLLVVFAFCGINLLVSIIMTITTNPGEIPKEGEWDMKDTLATPKPQETSRNFQMPFEQDQFDNAEIVEDSQNPREQSHFDYRFIRSKAGPSYENEYDDQDEAALIRQNTKTLLKKKTISFERKKQGGIRMCQRCLKTKPDRTHHCSQCNKCILKMDHHCPWVNNCIGFYNYKYFINMLFYASATSMLVVVTAYPVFLATLGNDDINIYTAYFIVTSWILSCAFCLLITVFFSFHLWLMSQQYTTIEYCEKRSSADGFKMSPYNIGCCGNYATVLGKNFFFWCFPCDRNLEGRGIHYQVRDDLIEKFDEEGNLKDSSKPKSDSLGDEIGSSGQGSIPANSKSE